jgi:hypothetical protein
MSNELITHSKEVENIQTAARKTPDLRKFSNSRKVTTSSATTIALAPNISRTRKGEVLDQVPRR